METNTFGMNTVLPSFVKIGRYNKIGNNVRFIVSKSCINPILEIGDCNVIGDNVKILISDEGVFIKDWNVIHNDTFLIGENKISIQSNCWIGQNCIIDGSGVLEIGNGVRIGMYSQIWTHVASGEQIEGCVLFAQRKTIIEDDVWLVGSCIVGSGLVLGKRSICLTHSLVTKDMEENSVYSGSPATLMSKVKFYKKVSLLEKFQMLEGWVQTYIESKNERLNYHSGHHYIKVENDLGEQVVFCDNSTKKDNVCSLTTWFNVENKCFNKTFSSLERDLYGYLYNNKARFKPF